MTLVATGWPALMAVRSEPVGGHDVCKYILTVQAGLVASGG